MDSIDISGKKYISSKQAASLTGYAQDYVGQLARSGKIPGTRVGRAWYIEKDAILKHAGITEEVSVDSSELKTPPEASEVVKPQKLTLASVHQEQKTTKPLHSLRQTNKENFSTWGNVRYLDDAADLLPKLQVNRTEKSSVRITKNIVNPPKLVPKETIKSFEPSPTKTTTPHTHHNNKSLQILPLGLAAAAVGIMLVGSAASGIYLPDSWSYGSGAQIASLGGDYGPILSIFVTFFQEGVTLLVAFATFFLNSIETFFDLGSAFLKGISQ